MLRTFFQSAQSLNKSNVRTYSNFTYSVPHPLSLEPGLVLIKAALSPQEQQQLSREMLTAGIHEKNGFWKLTPDNNKVLNSRPYRGRMFNSLTNYPPILTSFAKKHLAFATQVDDTLKPVMPTHGISLYYTSLAIPPENGFIPWHQDNGENDGENDYPIISFNLGDSCDFLIAHSKPVISVDRPINNPINLAHKLRFESGDILFFGGASRKIWHGIYKIYPNTAPNFLPFSNARLNLTLRHTPKLFGQEVRFATQDAQTLPRTNQFYDTLKMK